MRLFFLVGHGRDLATMYHRYLSSGNSIFKLVIVVEMGNHVQDQRREISTNSLFFSPYRSSKGRDIRLRMLPFLRLEVVMTLHGLASVGVRGLSRLVFVQKNGHGRRLDGAQFVRASKRRLHRWSVSDIIQSVGLARFLALAR